MRTLGWALGVLALPSGIATTAGADPLVMADPDPVKVASAVPAPVPVPVPAPVPAAVPVPVAVRPGDAVTGNADTAPDMPMPMPLSVDTTRGLSLSVGGSEWGGKFGGPTDSTVDVIFGNARYRQGNVRFNATLPWMRIRSDTAIYTGIDGSPLIVGSGQTTVRRTRSGLADLTLGANWLALDEDSYGADFEVSGRIKLPTASDSSGLSTGKVDYSIAGELSRSIGIVTPSVRLGYRFLSDFDGVDLKNGFASSIGASVIVFQQSVALLSYDFTERASRFIRDAHEISLGLSTPLGSRFRLNSYGSVGLSSGAADLSAGLSLTVGLGR